MNLCKTGDRHCGLGAVSFFLYATRGGVYAWERCTVHDLASTSNAAREPDHFGCSPTEFVDEFRYKRLQTQLIGCRESSRLCHKWGYTLHTESVDENLGTEGCDQCGKTNQKKKKKKHKVINKTKIYKKIQWKKNKKKAQVAVYRRYVCLVYTEPCLLIKTFSPFL